MILVIGGGRDPVCAAVAGRLHETRQPFAVIDEDEPERYGVRRRFGNGETVSTFTGGSCTGQRPVGSVFVRHTVAETRDLRRLRELGRLQLFVNYALAFTGCTVVNSPKNSYSNYAKPYQVGLLADAGFDVPATIVTNIPREARRFCEQHSGSVIVKGVSNVLTLARKVDKVPAERFELLPTSPTMFQEYIEGTDYRVNVTGERVFVTRLVSEDEDYRRLLQLDVNRVTVESVDIDLMPSHLIRSCVAITRRLGLIVSGLDFKGTRDGRFVALELNPYPQFTFYEARSGQRITAAVVELLVENHTTESNILV